MNPIPSAHHQYSMPLMLQPIVRMLMPPTGLVHSLSDLVAKVVAFVQVVSISTSVQRWLLTRFVFSVEL